jgi:hypothetical protein
MTPQDAMQAAARETRNLFGRLKKPARTTHNPEATPMVAMNLNSQ